MNILPICVDAVDRRAVEAREHVEHDKATRQALAEALTDIPVLWFHTVRTGSLLSLATHLSLPVQNNEESLAIPI